MLRKCTSVSGAHGTCIIGGLCFRDGEITRDGVPIGTYDASGPITVEVTNGDVWLNGRPLSHYGTTHTFSAERVEELAVPASSTCVSVVCHGSVEVVEGTGSLRLKKKSYGATQEAAAAFDTAATTATQQGTSWSVEAGECDAVLEVPLGTCLRVEALNATVTGAFASGITLKTQGLVTLSGVGGVLKVNNSSGDTVVDAATGVSGTISMMTGSITVSGGFAGDLTAMTMSGSIDVSGVTLAKKLKCTSMSGSVHVAVFAPRGFDAHGESISGRVRVTNAVGNDNGDGDAEVVVTTMSGDVDVRVSAIGV